MKKFTVLVALALLAATGTSYAVTCSYDNVPGATLLVPYFKVSRNGATTGPIAEGGVDTMVAITNVSNWGVIAHVTVWSKWSAPVLDFNVPMTGFDVAFFRMKDILNGSLNVNGNTQKLNKDGVDPCKNPAFIGSTKTTYMRFTHPYWGTTASDATSGDWFNSIAFYATPAFSGTFRNKIWDSLDESADYVSLVSEPAIDEDNPACGTSTDAQFQGDFTGYLTIDVVNYCTNWFPNQTQFYTFDAIATAGWVSNTPNVLMGDVFFLDPAAAGGNISGDAAIALEFDTRLTSGNDWSLSPYKTFYARYSVDPLTVDALPAAAPAAPGAYQFSGDGREPLGTVYGFRYLNDAAAGLQTWASIWRGDYWDADNAATLDSPAGSDLCEFDSRDNLVLDRNGRQILISTWDNDEAQNSVTGGGPSGDTPVDNSPYVWWETNRVIISGNTDMNPAGFKGGWTRFTFNPNNSTRYNQAYIAVQHTAPGAYVSVGHSATLIDQQFQCPAPLGFPTVAGNQGY